MLLTEISNKNSSFQIPVDKFEYNELKIWGKLSGGPSILELYGAVRKGKHVIIFMEFMAGTVWFVSQRTWSVVTIKSFLMEWNLYSDIQNNQVSVVFVFIN